MHDWVPRGGNSLYILGKRGEGVHSPRPLTIWLTSEGVLLEEYIP